MAERELRVESAGRKVKHFRAAAEHLRQVGADDLRLLRQHQGKVVEREARELKRQLKAAGGESRDGSADGSSLEDLRRQIERLRLELDEVARTVEELEPRNKKVDNPSPRGHETE
jgi:predicted RNase H-like nuclease (RuvC/YqgF family)